MSVIRVAAVSAIILILSACAPKVTGVFEGRPETWDAKARQLALVDRYKAFRYGVTKLMPPAILAVPMADGGKQAVDLIQAGNQQKPDDKVILASLHVYDSMKQAEGWNICINTSEIRIAIDQEALIGDQLIKQRYHSFLHDICPQR